MQARATWMIITGSTWNGTQRFTFLNNCPQIAFSHCLYRDDLNYDMLCDGVLLEKKSNLTLSLAFKN